MGKIKNEAIEQQQKALALKPLFVPLHAPHFEAFEAGRKTYEYRKYGSRWNEKTCLPGRRVTLSYGYGKQRRIKGIIKSFTATKVDHCVAKDVFREIYGNINNCLVAEIEITLCKKEA